MNASIIAASFILGTLNPKIGAAIHTRSKDQAPASTQAADAHVPDRHPERSGRANAPASEAKTNQLDSAKSRSTKASSPSKATSHGKTFSRKSRRLDPDRSGFSALIPASSKVMTVRVTVYWKNGSGSDYYSSRGMSASGQRLINKRSAAVDPALIPYGSRILLPEVGKELVAVDTGTAVKKRTAAKKLGKDVPVVDIFFECKKEALDFASDNPLFMKAVVIN